MTQEEKDLLMKDLCARLPYGIYVKFKQYNKPLCLSVKDALAICNGGEIINDLQYLYLRPMSSMTEEEENEYQNIVENDGNWVNLLSQNLMDFFNRYHLDYRGLIPMGLALEASEGMYK